MNDMSGNELVSIEHLDALATFTQPGAIGPIMAKIREAIERFEPDMSTAAGRKAIASMAYKITRSKTYLDGVGKKLNDEQKEVPKKIDATRKQIRDTLDLWAADVRAPLTAWEEAEEKRINAHKEKLTLIGEYAKTEGCSAADIEQRLHAVEAFPLDAACEEFIDEYMTAVDQAIPRLKSALASQQKLEADQAELERLRAEEAVRKQKEREEAIAREAAEKAKAEAEAIAAKREAELKRAAEDAERRAKDAEDLARARALKEAADAAAEAEKREANKRHRVKIEKEAFEGLIGGGLSRDDARMAITLIARKEIPHISITY